MPNYQLGKIYKIVHYTNNNNYIGSTCEPILARRLAGHVSDYKCYLNNKKKYITSFKVLENSNYNIVLIEEYPCDTKDQLLARERYYIDTLDCVNKNRAGILNELGKINYYKQPYIIEYMQIINHNHHEKNKQKIHDRKNKKFNCECC